MDSKMIERLEHQFFLLAERSDISTVSSHDLAAISEAMVKIASLLAADLF